MSTTGIELKTRNRTLAEAVELVSSMRFSISLLTLIAVASMIGTVMKQNEPMTNYVNQFGPFWFDVFGKLSLYSVYSAWWFLLIMAFLVLSTSLCLIRNAPKMIADMRSWRENVRETSLRNFHHKHEWTAPLSRVDLAQQSAARLADAGYSTKLVEKDKAVLVTAKKGAANKFGYIFAHGAIVIICIGGLLDSDMPIRFQTWFMGKAVFEPPAGGIAFADIPAKHRLGVGNLTYRGNTLIPEGGATSIAQIQQAKGVLIQELPFTLQLKKFHIDFYSTGMPKLFASDVMVRDHETGKTFPATIKVNEPLIYKGVAVYQSSFEDGGTKLTMKGYPLQGDASEPFAMSGEVGTSNALKRGSEEYTVEWSGFRPFNVENLAQDTRTVAKETSLSEQFAVGLDKHSGSAAKNANSKDLKNVGPSVQYKLRDKAGQAREYQNYMQPVTVDGASVFLAGMRATPAEPFSYLRIPADDEHTVKEWMRLRAALADPVLRDKAAANYANRAMPSTSGKSPELQQQLQLSAAKSLSIFAGDTGQGGFVAVSNYLQKIPKEDQEKIANVFMKLLNGTMWELWQVARDKAGLPPVAADDAHGRFLQLSINAYSDSFFYAAPVYLQLDDFVEVKASVLQVTRSPGKNVVYLGCLFLVMGVFAMFYIRERRIWVWVREDGGTATALMAMSTQRKTLDFEHEFEDLKTKLPQAAK
jgi:cytochrome c biogenesis protein